MPAVKRYNASLRNLEYRLRAFKEIIPQALEEIIRSKEDVIISAIADDQLYRRGVNGRDEKIMDYAPYTATTVRIKQRKGQPTTRVTLRDTGSFHQSMYVVYDSEGFYITSSDQKTEELKAKYGAGIFRLTNKNFNRILKVHIRRGLAKKLKEAIKG